MTLTSCAVPRQLWLEFPLLNPKLGAGVVLRSCESLECLFESSCFGSFSALGCKQNTLPSKSLAYYAALPSIWELVNGTMIVWGTTRLVLQARHLT